MRIGIDIDDTVAKTYETMRIELLKQGYDLDTYDNIYHKHPLVEEIYGKRSDELSLVLPLKKNAKEIINTLKKQGNEIYFITARSKKFYQNAYNTTYNWLINNGIMFDKLIVEAAKKDAICEENNIDLFIDDSIEHVKSVNEKNIRGIIYTSRYNKDIKELERINDWNELLDVI